MKQFLTISVFLLHLFGCLSFVAAKAPTQLKTESSKGIASLSTFSFYHDSAADLTQLSHLHCTAFKVRDQRSSPGLISYPDFIERSPYYFQEASIDHLSLPFLALRQLLIFPKHYFW